MPKSSIENFLDAVLSLIPSCQRYWRTFEHLWQLLRDVSYFGPEERQLLLDK